MKSKRIILAAWLGVVTLLGSVGVGLPVAPVQAAVADWQKGVTYQGSYDTEFSSATFQEAMRAAKSDGANYATLVLQYHQDAQTSSIVYRAGDTPTDASVRDAVSYVHSLGMKVMLKPHVDSNTGQWRAFIDPADRSVWFKSYGDSLTSIAQLSAATGVDQLCIGAELVSLTRPDKNPANTAGWNGLIDRVKGVYAGPLTYSAQRADGSSVDEVSTLGFWSRLNFIGVSAYYPLNGASVDTMKQSWAGIDASYLQPIAAKYGKSLLFTEIGYRSASNAAAEPYEYNNGTVDQGLQDRLYEALFSYWSGRSYMAGVALWDFNSAGATSYNPRGKLAESTLKKWFGGGSGGVVTPTPTPTPVPSATPTPSPTPAPIVNTDPGTVTTAASVSPVAPAVGSPATVTTTVTAVKTASQITIDTEIYDASGARVWQKFYENQTLSAGTAKNYADSWTPAAAGTYAVKVGVFKTGWTPTYVWNDAATSVKVGATATPTPSPSSTPTPTPTPTPSATPTPAPTPTPSPTPNPTPAPTPAPTTAQISVWWPGEGVSVSGVQPFKAVVQGLALGAYSMLWQVDGGVLAPMGDSNTDGPHKESLVDLSNWWWQSSGRYRITFVARDLQGRTIATKDVMITVTH